MAVHTFGSGTDYPEITEGVRYDAKVIDVKDKMKKEFKNNELVGEFPSRMVVFEITDESTDEGAQKGRYVFLNLIPKMHEKAGWVTKVLKPFFDKVEPGFQYDDMLLVGKECEISLKKNTRTPKYPMVDAVMLPKGAKKLKAVAEEVVEVKGEPLPAGDEVPF